MGLLVRLAEKVDLSGRRKANATGPEIVLPKSKFVARRSIKDGLITFFVFNRFDLGCIRKGKLYSLRSDSYSGEVALLFEIFRGGSCAMHVTINDARSTKR